jgi:inner membrane protein YidH
MSATSATPKETVANHVVPNSTDLAVDRTRLAHERTMMAWVRTSASLISFGFTIHKFFQYLKGQGVGHEHLFGPREFGLLMIGIGLIVLLVATLQNRHDLKVLRRNFPSTVPYSTATFVSSLICVLGVVAFIAVLLRL